MVKLVEVLMRETLPKKNFFNIQEVTALLNVKQQDVRTWETEFPQVRAQKTKAGQRIYRREDVVLLASIRHLLQEKKLTVAGAQKIIAESDQSVTPEIKTEQKPKDAQIASANIESNASPGISSVAKSGNVDHTTAEKPLNPHEDDRLLEEASRILHDGEDEDDDDFDDFTHQIYQQCANDLESANVTIEPHHVGEMLADALVQNQQKEKGLPQLEQEKALAILAESKKSLSDLLTVLDKYRESNFWLGFDEK